MADRRLNEPVLPYPHLLTHPTRAMILVYTPEAEAENLAQDYVVVPVDTRQISLIFTRRMQIAVSHG